MTSEDVDDGRAGQTQRIDKWLWHARIVKTRTRATKLALAGALRLNKQRVTRASQQVRTGDILTFMISEQVKVLRVTGFAERRGSAELTKGLYEDLSPPPVQRESGPDGAPTPLHGGRPTKKARRTLDQIIRSWLK